MAEIVRLEKLVNTGQSNVFEFNAEEYVGYIITKIGASNDIDEVKVETKSVLSDITSTYAPIDEVNPYTGLDFDLGDHFIVLPPKNKLTIRTQPSTDIRLYGLAIKFDPKKEKFEQIAKDFMVRYDVQDKIQLARKVFTATLWDNTGGSSDLTIAAGTEKDIATITLPTKEEAKVTAVYGTITTGFENDVNLLIRHGIRAEKEYDPEDAGFGIHNRGLPFKNLTPYKANQVAKIPVPLEIPANGEIRLIAKVSNDITIQAGKKVDVTVILDMIRTILE